MQFTSWENPMGTDGFEFIEYAAPDPAAMGRVFEQMGFRPIAKHRHKKVLLYRQGTINFIVNSEPDSFAQRFARQHGPSICAIAFRVQDAKAAYERTISLGAWGFAPGAGPGELNIPAIKGIGDSLIYFVDRWRGKNGAQPGDIGNIGFYDVDFEALPGLTAVEALAPEGGTLQYYFRGDGPARTLVAVDRVGASGAPLWRTAYEDHETAGGVRLPQMIRFAEGKGSFDDGVEIKFKERTLNAAPAAGAFTLAPPAGATVVDVGCGAPPQ